MTKIFKSKNQVVFLTKSNSLSKKGEFDIILSPEYYWVKRVELPVKNERAALKLAPSIYEGSLPSGEYAYMAQKSGDKFIIIAYNREEISNQLQKQIVLPAKIKNVYFTQNELQSIKECTTVNENAALTNMNDLIIQVPRSCTNSKDTLQTMLNEMSLSNKKVALSSLENEVIDKKDFMLAAVLASLLLGAFLVEYGLYKNEISKVEDKRASIIKKYDLPRTSIQLKSIKSTLSSTYKKQKRFRDILYSISKLHLNKGEYIESISENEKESTLVLHILDAKRESVIKNQFAKVFTLKGSNVQGNKLTIKIAS